MIRRKSAPRFVFFVFTLFLLLSFAAFLSSAEDSPDNDDEFEELVAIDEQGDEEDGLQHGEQQKEAEVLSKAQRIVLELNFENAKRVISENELVMILGYAPWCPRSAELMPQFAEAANKLKELGSPLLMAKLDAERYPKAASMLDIKGFPTLLLFVNGTSQVYTGGFSAEDIVIWTRKKTGVPVIRVESVPEAEELVKKYQTFVLGFFEKFEGRDYDEFLKAAVSDNEIQFLETNDLAVAKVLYPDVKSTDFLGIVKSEPERYSRYEGTFETQKILHFLDHNKFPLVIRLTDLNSGRVYSSPIKLQVMIFAEPDKYKTVVEPLQEVAKKFKTKIMFIYVDINDEDIAKPFLTLFGLEDSQNAAVTAFDNRISSKYLLESDPTASNIEDFCSRLLLGSQSPYYKSQPVPDNTNATVHDVVGKTFDELVLNSPKNVFLEVYTPWCINCETTSKKVEKLAKHFKGLDSLVFAKIDASVNEHSKLQVEDYPLLQLYLAGDKTNPIKLSTKSSSKELAAAINKYLKAKQQTAKDEL